jgi:magnesium transporter
MTSALDDLSPQEAAEVAEHLGTDAAALALAELHPQIAASIVSHMDAVVAAPVVAAMHPDDRVDVLEGVPTLLREELLSRMDDGTAAVVRSLARYRADTAGGIMTNDVVALAHELTVDQAIEELRRRGAGGEPMFYLYVVDAEGRLIGVLSTRDILLAEPETILFQIMRSDLVTLPAGMDQEDVARVMKQHRFMALPVVGSDGKLLGVVTADDVADVTEEEATEDIQRLGGTAALDAPYLHVSMLSMLRKRGGWLTILFLGETLTATAMGHFEAQIAKAVVLALFIPLIVSSGGNSGSQSATLIVRSLALAELRLQDWWRVLMREARVGLALGAWLGLIGFVRIALWQQLGWANYGPHHVLVGLTVATSLTGVVLFGCIVGSILPFLLRAFGLDPATSSSPFVATFVDVTGLIIYFSVAGLLLRHTMFAG